MAFPLQRDVNSPVVSMKKPSLYQLSGRIMLIVSKIITFERICHEKLGAFK
jgi:hypothetical protein